MPSACEAQENGVDLLEMQVKLLKSLEELTLHVIDLKKENDALKTEIEKLK
jgi:regulator of replication initiation timing